MPYINNNRRWDFENGLDLFMEDIETDGELNYCITKLCLKFLGNDYNYSKLNSVIGVLESAKQEFYRRKVSPYEDNKIKENGDVY